MILDMHEALLGESQPEIIGQWRNTQVWIGGGDYGPHGAQFVPFHHDLVPEAIGSAGLFSTSTDTSVRSTNYRLGDTCRCDC